MYTNAHGFLFNIKQRNMNNMCTNLGSLFVDIITIDPGAMLTNDSEIA